jgi:hypothetical protein
MALCLVKHWDNFIVTLPYLCPIRCYITSSVETESLNNLRITRVYIKYSGPSRWWNIRLTTINTRWEATQKFMVVKLTTLTHQIAIQLHLVAESWTIFICRSRWPSGNFWIHPFMILKQFYPPSIFTNYFQNVPLNFLSELLICRSKWPFSKRFPHQNYATSFVSHN